MGLIEHLYGVPRSQVVYFLIREMADIYLALEKMGYPDEVIMAMLKLELHYRRREGRLDEQG